MLLFEFVTFLVIFQNKKERIICITKTDAWDEKYIKSLEKLKFREPKTQVFLISAVMGTNIEELKMAIWDIIVKDRERYS